MDILLIVLIIVMAIVLHEYAHGWMAYKLGDPTAKSLGRLTLNPIKHMDLVGSVILPGALIIMRMMGVPVIPIGWAKPVPVNFQRLNNPKRDMIWVAIAGPAINIFLALLFSLLVRMDVSLMVQNVAAVGVFLNLLLAVFNMIPVPPLDGSRIVMGLLPNQYALKYSRLERFGILIVFLLLPLGLLTKVVIPVVKFLANILGVQI